MPLDDKDGQHVFYINNINQNPYKHIKEINFYELSDLIIVQYIL